MARIELAALVGAMAALSIVSVRPNSARASVLEAPSGLGAPPVRYATAPAGNTARYRVREKLVGHDFPNDAVGNTSSVTGSLVLDANGKIDTAQSKFLVDVKPLKSDQDKRDGYVQSHILETSQYPTVTFVPTSTLGLPPNLPASGALSFELRGNLTVHGKTMPVSWHVSAHLEGPDMTGNAYTVFTFADAGLSQPHVPVLLSLEDTIHLEYDFHLVKQ
ncbi:MAG TPA: YceI family protein [Gemmatimonadaceae bacterium]|nr:YceI family protein [Gemmatimonadaceae bacterium]